jgi:hypothetical protein
MGVARNVVTAQIPFAQRQKNRSSVGPKIEVCEKFHKLFVSVGTGIVHAKSVRQLARELFVPVVCEKFHKLEEKEGRSDGGPA